MMNKDLIPRHIKNAEQAVALRQASELNIKSFLIMHQ